MTEELDSFSKAGRMFPSTEREEISTGGKGGFHPASVC
jgi:hypothetical protein